MQLQGTINARETQNCIVCNDCVTGDSKRRHYGSPPDPNERHKKRRERIQSPRARVSISSDLIPDLSSRGLDASRRREYSTMKYRASRAVSRTLSRELLRASPSTRRGKKRARKKRAETGRKNPFTAFRRAASRAETFPVGRFHEERVKAKNPRNGNRKCRRVVNGGIVRAHPWRQEEGGKGEGGLKPGTQPFIYLAARSRVVTRRVRERRVFSPFRRISPQIFSWRAAPFSPPPWPIYTIFWKSFIRFRSPPPVAVGLARGPAIVKRPLSQWPRQMGERACVVRGTGAKKKFVKRRRGFREIRVDARET